MIINKIINKFSYYLKFLKFKKQYSKINNKNFTVPGNIFDLNKVKVGDYTYGTINVREYGLNEEMLSIGNYCSIADKVIFFLAGEHGYKRLSTYPFKTMILNHGEECISKGKVVVQDDVWIGHGAIILSGVTIGQGAIIGAGSVVAKDIPPYAIYANGKIIKYRFKEEVINKLLKVDFSKLDRNKISDNLDMLYADINEQNAVEIIEKLEV